jgi:hypothetical protein
MDGINLVYLQDEILAHIESEFPAYDIIDDIILDDEYLLKIKNNVKPFVVVQWGGLSRSGTEASFAGVRHDEYRSNFSLAAVAPTPKIARNVSNMFMDKLIGWKIDGSALTPSSGIRTFAVKDANSKPHLYIASGTLSFRFNSSNPNANITL